MTEYFKDLKTFEILIFKPADTDPVEPGKPQESCTDLLCSRQDCPTRRRSPCQASECPAQFEPLL